MGLRGAWARVRSRIPPVEDYRFQLCVLMWVKILPCKFTGQPGFVWWEHPAGAFCGCRPNAASRQRVQHESFLSKRITHSSHLYCTMAHPYISTLCCVQLRELRASHDLLRPLHPGGIHGNCFHGHLTIDTILDLQWIACFGDPRK